jgi:hypothetical protein
MNVILTDQNILDRLWCESKGGITGCREAWPLFPVLILKWW